MEGLQGKSSQEIKDMIYSSAPEEVEVKETPEIFPAYQDEEDEEDVEIGQETYGKEFHERAKREAEKELEDSVKSVMEEYKETDLREIDWSEYVNSDDPVMRHLAREKQKKANDQETIEMAISRQLEVSEPPQVDFAELQPAFELEFDEVQKRFGIERTNQLTGDLKRLAADGLINYSPDGTVTVNGVECDNAMDVFFQVASLRKDYSSSELRKFLPRTDEHGEVTNPIRVRKRVQKLFSKPRVKEKTVTFPELSAEDLNEAISDFLKKRRSA